MIAEILSRSDCEEISSKILAPFEISSDSNETIYDLNLVFD